MDFATVQVAVERASVIYALRHHEPEVEAAFDRILDAMAATGAAPAPGAKWNPPPEWCERVHGLAHALIVRYGCDA